MASTGKAKEHAILPPDAFKYLNSIKLHRPDLLDLRKRDRSFDHIPPPSHRVMVYKAELESERTLSTIKNAYEWIPYYTDCCFKELLQWLHRFDFTQDDELDFAGFLSKILRSHTPGDPYHTPIFETQTHEFELIGGYLAPMNAAAENKPFTDVKDEKFMRRIHEFKPALQVECDSGAEESILPLRFGLPIGKVVCSKKEQVLRGEDFFEWGYTPFHLVFHPIDKSFWMVVDRYRDWDGRLCLDDDDEPYYQDNEEIAWTLRSRLGESIVMAEAFRLGSKDFWFPQGLGLIETEKQARPLDGAVGFDGNKSEEPLLRYDRNVPRPTIELSSLPRVSLFRDTDPLQVHLATHTCFQRYLAENGVVQGQSWLSLSPVPI
ncbi:hypothetical protein AYL99_11371 [Fonsecaea erecta]|uniref:Uncharacterized protein n=1 Tax=Fonsecaea erecta TaxID=1367422 RepID=A0A178Z3E8_9EURO|nr:hypothetical protein AYL99_11371 [Fonsecaea erecta]OAP54270.1 hypothetical protein AYL99_11371 [Fonsecaea erecta]